MGISFKIFGGNTVARRKRKKAKLKSSRLVTNSISKVGGFTKATSSTGGFFRMPAAKAIQ